jgi:hypothetical protein
VLLGQNAIKTTDSDAGEPLMMVLVGYVRGKKKKNNMVLPTWITTYKTFWVKMRSKLWTLVQVNPLTTVLVW